MLEAVDLASPGLEFLDGTYFWEANPRYAGANQTPHDKFFREKVGVDANGASIDDPKDIATYSHMFGCWETLYTIKQAVEASGYKSPPTRGAHRGDRGDDGFPAGNEHPQGDKTFNGATSMLWPSVHLEGRGQKLNVVHQTSIEDGLYENDTDYTKQPL